MKRLIVLIILTISSYSYAQHFMINTFEFGWSHRTHYEQSREVPLILNTDGTIISDGGMAPVNKDGVTNVVFPCYMTLSVFDMIRMKHGEEKKYRFGDLIGLFPIYAGSAKMYTNEGTEKAINFGAGFFIGGFFMYHFHDDFGVGVNYKWDVVLDAIIDYKSDYSYYEPMSYYSVLVHYKRLSLELSTSFNLEPSEQKMNDYMNDRLLKNKYDNIGNYYVGNSQRIDFKYFFSKKFMISAKYEFLHGDAYQGNQDQNQAKLYDYDFSHPYVHFELQQKNKFNNTTLTIGYLF